LNRAADLVEGFMSDARTHEATIWIVAGPVVSSQVLLAMIDKGLTREEAYKSFNGFRIHLSPETSGQEACFRIPRPKIYRQRNFARIFSGKKQIERSAPCWMEF